MCWMFCSMFSKLTIKQLERTCLPAGNKVKLTFWNIVFWQRTCFVSSKEWNLPFGSFTFRLDNQSFVMFLCSEYIRENFCISNAVNSMAKQVKDLFKYFSKDSKIYYFVYYQLNFLTFSMPNLCYFKIKGNEVLVLSLW